MPSFVWIRSALVAAALAAASSTTAALTLADRPEAVRCSVKSPATALAGLPEASGVAGSRRHVGLLWTINDSGQPVVFGIDSAGRVRTRVRLTGATVDDWEDVSVGRCGKGTCLYIADIGDNNARRNDVVIYRVPEPNAAGDSEVAAEAFRATYPDGAHDAEALFAAPDGTLYIVTKEEQPALYRLPALRAGTPLRMEKVGPIDTGIKGRITDADASADGRWVALRSNDAVLVYPLAAFAAGRSGTPARVDVEGLREPQGEGVAVGPGGMVYLVGEGGGKGRPGTIATIACAM
jgi:hypothetical protein